MYTLLVILNDNRRMRKKYIDRVKMEKDIEEYSKYSNVLDIRTAYKEVY